MLIFNKNLRYIIYFLEIYLLFLFEQHTCVLLVLSSVISICMLEKSNLNIFLGAFSGFLLDISKNTFVLYILFLIFTGYLIKKICTYFIKTNITSCVFVNFVTLILFLIINIFINYFVYNINILSLCKNKYIYLLVNSLIFSVIIYYFNYIIWHFMGEKHREKRRKKI